MIKKVGGKYVVLSENIVRRGSLQRRYFDFAQYKSGQARQARRKFGTYKTLAEAKKRLRQVEFFKHVRRQKI